MNRRASSRVFIAGIASLALAGIGCSRVSKPLPGLYRATLTLPGGELPFQLEVADKSGSTGFVLINGDERIEVTDVTVADGNFTAKFPGIENRMQAQFDRNSMKGEVTMIRKNGEEQKLPFGAERDKNYLFFEKSLSDNADVAGRWEVTFTGDDGTSYPAVAEFTQTHDRVTGTFLTGTGDHHFLAGQIHGEELRLSMFNGQHAFLYRAKLDSEGALIGEYWSGSHSHERFVAKRNAQAVAPQEATVAKQESLAFTFPDLSGKPVSMSDDRFKNKVVLVTLGGSWCGNCHDEARFLAPFFDRYRDRGFEVVGLMFERFGEFEKAVEAASRFRDHFKIKYTMLIAGISDTDDASQKFPQLSHVYAFPTSVLLDRRGKIRKIHTGFSGPATGIHFDEYKKEFSEAVESLLNEK